MPTYGYECLNCERQFEIQQSIKDAPLTICETCGGTLRKRVYPVGIAFKGTGFYVNDYAPPSGGTAKPESSEGSVATETKPDGAQASEAKPAEPPASDVKAETAKTTDTKTTTVPAKPETKAAT